MSIDKKHGLTGNKNAAKERPASAALHIRLRPEEKAEFTAAATAAGLSLSAWTLAAMRERVGK
ncbi:hypothetical protein E1B77_20730 [Salmonella enterica subsp. enterica]|nr:hypothetical protein [Salmonella enterica subsp. enterica serovar Suberu]ECF1703331.1 hypothetical protein [Salmonella enterica subsp. enterica]ECI7956934.1 hypothetical protein [Salmonella enterica subsp. enterica]